MWLEAYQICPADRINSIIIVSFTSSDDGYDEQVIRCRQTIQDRLVDNGTTVVKGHAMQGLEPCSSFGAQRPDAANR